MIYSPSIVSANQNQPPKRKAEASNETSALIISAIYCTLLPTTITLPYCQLLYLTVSLPTIRRKCHAPRHYRFNLGISWICTPLGQDDQQIKQIASASKAKALSIRATICADGQEVSPSGMQSKNLRLRWVLSYLFDEFFIRIVILLLYQQRAECYIIIAILIVVSFFI